VIARRDAGSEPGVRPLRIAVPKGALFRDSVCALQGAGLDVGTLADPGRQLTIHTPEVEFVIGKPADMPVYVAYGGVDCAIAGKDVLLESALDVVEMVDLRFGACRFVVAGPEGSDTEVTESYAHLGVIRVATKYPRITEAYFAEQGVQVEIVKLNGNIEIAPLIGLADRIVDITATGTTLAENQLCIVDDVLESTARFVANPVSLRLDAERITALAGRLAGSVRA
jgi:ATP phosphoribosyltransferase